MKKSIVQSTKKRVTFPLLRLNQWGMGMITLLVLITLWEIGSRVGVVDPYALPRPSVLAGSLFDMASVGFPMGVTVWNHVSATVWRIIRGFILATSVAIPLGLIIGGNRVLDKPTNPIVTFARSMAIISLLPLAIAWFGVGELSKVLLIAYGCFWTILTNVIEGTKQVDPGLLRAGRMLGANQKQIFFRVILPATMPRIFAGMKVALGVGFMIIVAVEMVGTIEGLGALLMQARSFYRSDVAMVGMIFIALFGFLLSKILDRLERILLPWATGLEQVER